MGNSHKGWAIYNFRNKKQRLQGKYLSMHRLLLPAKESFKGRSGQYFLGNNPLRRTQPFGCLELFSIKIPNLPHRVISVFWAFKQISSPTKVIITDNPKKLEKTLSTSQHMMRELFIPLGGSGNWCHMSGADTPSAINSGPPCQRYFHTSWNISVLDFHIRRSVLWLTFLVNTVQYFVNIFVFFSKVCVQNDGNLLKTD